VPDHKITMELIARAQEGDEHAKTQLIVENSPLIKSIVRRYKNKGVEYDDLYQLGCLGLVKAILHFDHKYGVQFSTYAVPMIAGEIKRFLRDDGAIKVSRQIKSTAARIYAFIDDHLKRTGAKPSLELLCEEFSVDQSELIFIMDSNKMPVSIYERTDEGDEGSPTLMDRIPSGEQADDLVDRLVVKTFLEALPEKERELMVLRYFRDKTQSEIAKVIGVSQVQVSRMESRILKKFREAFEVI